VYSLDLRCRHAVWQFQTKIIYPAVKQWLMLTQEDGNCTHLNQLDVRNLLVVSGVPQISEGQLLCAPGKNLTISKPTLKRSVFKRVSWLQGSFFGG
jgi:hypothetical protein